MCTIGDLFLVDFPFVEEYQFKERPALLVAKLYDESFVCCMVTKKKNQFDICIPLTNEDMAQGKTDYIPSYIRPMRMTTVNPKRFGRKIGRINDRLMELVRDISKKALAFTDSSMTEKIGMAAMEHQARIRNIALFEGLAEPQLAELAGIAGLREYAAGQELFQAGDEARGFYGVLGGRVKVYKVSPEGREHILQTFGPGETVAEAAVLQGRVYPASAQMLETGELLYFPRDRFRALLRDDPDLSLSLLGLLAERLRGFVRKIEALSLKEVPSRLAAHLLLLQSSQKSGSFLLDLPKGQLALLLGTIPETLSRVLGRLAQEGVLEVKGSRVSILDQRRLEEIAQEPD